MGINVGEVEAVLTARDQMSPTVVQVAQRVADLTQKLGVLGVESVKDFTLLNDQLKTATVALEGLTDKATVAAVQQLALGQNAQTAAASIEAVGTASDTAGDGLDKVKDKALSTGQSFQQLDGLATRLIERMALLYIVREGFTLTKDAFEGAAALVQMSSQLDMTISKLQEIQYGADQVNVPFSKVTSAIDTLDKKLAGASSTTQQALLDIGLSFNDVFTTDPANRFDLIAGALANMQDKSQRTAVEVKLFGTDAIDPLIVKLKELEAQAEKNGVVMGDDTIHALDNTLKMYRTWGAEIGGILDQLLDKGQQWVALLARPFVGGPLSTSERAGLSGIVGSFGGAFMGGADLAGAYGAMVMGAAPGATDINLPASGATKQATGPAMGWDFVSMLMARSGALKQLTADQKEQLDTLRNANILDAENAVRLQDSATKVNVTAQQYKAYVADVKEADDAQKSAAKSLQAYNDIMAKADADIAKAQASDKAVVSYSPDGKITSVKPKEGTLQDKLNAITMETQAAVEAAQKRIGWTDYEWEAENRLWELDQKRKQALIDNETLANSLAVRAVESGRGANLSRLPNEVGQPSLDPAMAKQWSNEYQQNLNVAKDAQVAFDRAVEQDYGDTIAFQIQKINEWRNNEEGKLAAGAANWNQTYDTIQQAANQRIQALIHAHDPLFQAWKQSTSDMRQEWAKAWDQAVGDYQLFITDIGNANASLKSDFEKLGIDLVDALLSPFKQMEQRLINIIGASAMNVENSLLSKVTGTNFGYPGAPQFGGSSSSVMGEGLAGIYGAGGASIDMIEGGVGAAPIQDALSGGVSAAAAGSAGMMTSMATGLMTMGIGTAISIGGSFLISGIKALFADHMPDDIARDAGTKFGQTWSDSLSKTVLANAKKFNDEVAGELASLPEIIKEHPIDLTNIDMYEGKVHDLFSMIQEGHMTTTEVGTELTQLWPELAAAGTDAYGRINDKLKELINLNAQYKTDSTAIATFLQQQATNASAGGKSVLDALLPDYTQYDALTTKLEDINAQITTLQSKKTLTPIQTEELKDLLAQQGTVQGQINRMDNAPPLSAADLQNLGTAAIGDYAASVAGGSTTLDALKAESGELTRLQQAYKDLGIDVQDAGLKQLFVQNQILTNNPNLLAGVDGLTKQMVALDNANAETADEFKNQQALGQAMFTQLKTAATDAGGGIKDALLPMQDYLHNAQIEAKALGVPLDDNTQAMIDQSKQLGIWQEDAKTAKTPIDNLADAIQRLTDYLEGIPPKVDSTVTTHFTYDDPGHGGQPTTGDNSATVSGGGLVGGGVVYASKGYIMRPSGTDVVPAMLSPGEAVLNPRGAATLGSSTIRALNSGHYMAGGGIIGNVPDFRRYGGDTFYIQPTIVMPAGASPMDMQVLAYTFIEAMRTDVGFLRTAIVSVAKDAVQ